MSTIDGMVVTASSLRADIYRLLDSVLDTGEPIEIERNGQRLRIIRAEPRSKLDRLVRRSDLVVGDASDLVEIDWSDTWKP